MGKPLQTKRKQRKMNILLIDADSTIPNIALGKLSTYHKMLGDSVSFEKLNISYYPHRKNKLWTINTAKFDKTYCSVIFDGSKKYITNNEDIVFGGTGVDLQTVLSDEIESCDVDYSLYPENDTSYGFITRGCIRNCKFCKVPEKEGNIHQVSTIDKIVQHKKVKFLDNNILAFPYHKEILQELIDKNIRCQFNQGLDIRLVDVENSKLLQKLNYIDQYTFAFDNVNMEKIVDEKLKLLSWARKWDLRFFVYVDKFTPMGFLFQRINFLLDRGCIPFIMRNINVCSDFDYADFYRDVAAYFNSQLHFFKKNVI